MLALCEVRGRLPRVAGILGLVAALLASAAEARAALILTLNPESRSAAPGETIVFQGTITNTTGVSLNATDMFLNFSGYDPAVFADLTQLLGLDDFTLLNNRVTGVIDLFSATVAANAADGDHLFDISIQDINNNTSDPVGGLVRVSSGPPAVPEAPSWVLAGSGAAIALALGRRRSRRGVAARGSGA